MFKKKDFTENQEKNGHNGHSKKEESNASNPTFSQEEASNPSTEETNSAENKLKESEDKYLRLYADFENYRKRTNQERLDLLMTANREMVLTVLPVLDDFERALAVMDKAADVESVKSGVAHIFAKFRQVLQQAGLREIESSGQAFDPDLHDAIAKIPSPEDMKGKIVDEVQKGYMLNNKIIRHAKVVVGE